jgi:hypothetical protein
MAVRRRPVIAEFTDRFGEPQVVHRGTSGNLSIRRKSPTVVLAMTKTVGRYVGERVRDERLKVGFTMEHLAERASLKGGKSAVYGIEQSLGTGVRLGTLYAIAAALNISPFSLLPPVAMVMSEARVSMTAAEKLAV